jgi:Zn-dependent oligopeptidase
MHDLVARTKYARHHGFGVTLELGEGIGMMFEQWCWLQDELTAMSMHYTRINPEENYRQRRFRNRCYNLGLPGARVSRLIVS